MKRQTILRTAAALGAACLVFFILAFGLGWHLLLSAALSIGVYAGLSLVLTPRVDRTARLFAGLPDGEELASIMEEAARDLKQVRLSAGKITDVKTHDEAAALADTGGRICEYLRRQPEKIPAAPSIMPALPHQAIPGKASSPTRARRTAVHTSTNTGVTRGRIFQGRTPSSPFSKTFRE